MSEAAWRILFVALDGTAEGSSFFLVPAHFVYTNLPSSAPSSTSTLSPPASNLPYLALAARESHADLTIASSNGSQCRRLRYWREAIPMRSRLCTVSSPSRTTFVRSVRKVERI
jgi:hypothetical protein